jgi:hypothetical protein
LEKQLENEDDANLWHHLHQNMEALDSMQRTLKSKFQSNPRPPPLKPAEPQPKSQEPKETSTTAPQQPKQAATPALQGGESVLIDAANTPSFDNAMRTSMNIHSNEKEKEKKMDLEVGMPISASPMTDRVMKLLNHFPKKEVNREENSAKKSKVEEVINDATFGNFKEDLDALDEIFEISESSFGKTPPVEESSLLLSPLDEEQSFSFTSSPSLSEEDDSTEEKEVQKEETKCTTSQYTSELRNLSRKFAGKYNSDETARIAKIMSEKIM